MQGGFGEPDRAVILWWCKYLYTGHLQQPSLHRYLWWKCLWRGRRIYPGSRYQPENGAMSKAYLVPTKTDFGYCQTSGLIINGYEDETGYVYVYFLVNSAKVLCTW